MWLVLLFQKYVSKATDIGETSLEYMLLSKYSHQPPSYETIHWWVCWMGFEWDSTTKSYYVDGHEKPDQVLHWAQFMKTYLTEIKPRCHRWISIDQEEFMVLQQSISNVIIHEGYSHHDHTIGIDMIEFHVDDHPSLQDLTNKKYPVFGGCMSVWARRVSRWSLN